MSVLQDLKLKDIDTLTLDSSRDELRVELRLPLGDQGELAEYEETIEFNQSTPHYLRAAATAFAEASARAIRERASRYKEAVRCDTCTGGCCHDPTGVARVTEEDLELLEARFGKVWISDNVDLYGEKGWTGHVGSMRRAPLGWIERTGCQQLTQAGCLIYKDRPGICRDYSAFTCGDAYNEDPEKVKTKASGKRTLFVFKG